MAGIVVVILLLLSQVVGSLLPPGPPPPASGQPATHEPGFSHAICTKKSIDWRKISLKTVTAQPIAGLLENLRGESKFEASDVAVVGEDIYVAFDNLESYGIFHKRLNHMSKKNRLVGHMGDESQYEGFTYRSKTGTFLATVEAEEDKNNNTTNDDDNHNNSSIRNKDGHQHAPPTYFVPAVHEVRLVHNDEHPENDSVEFIRECRVDFRLKRKNKGRYYQWVPPRGNTHLVPCGGCRHTFHVTRYEFKKKRYVYILFMITMDHDTHTQIITHTNTHKYTNTQDDWMLLYLNIFQGLKPWSITWTRRDKNGTSRFVRGTIVYWMMTARTSRNINIIVVVDTECWFFCKRTRRRMEAPDMTVNSAPSSASRYHHARISLITVR